MKKQLLCAVAVAAVTFGLSGVSAHAQDVASDVNTQTAAVVPAAPAAAPAPTPRPQFLSDMGRFTFFGGYSWLDTDLTEGADGDGDCNPICFGRTSGSGFDLSGTYMMNQYVGLTADFSGNYGGVTLHDGDGKDHLPQNSYYILFGPTVTKRVGKVQLSAHALVGIARLWAADDFTCVTCESENGMTFREDSVKWNTGLAVGVGGSADWMLGRGWGWRVVQVDYLWSDGIQQNYDGEDFSQAQPVHAVRIATGIVINLGHMR